MLFLRIFKHLLPDAAAWRLTIEKKLKDFFEGLAELPASARQFIDDVYSDQFASSTREIEEWEQQFGLNAAANDIATRRQAIDAAWKAQGGQSPRYLQDIIQAAGFNVFIHEWWDPTALPTIVARDPHDYTDSALVGLVQCRDTSSNPRRCRSKTQLQYRCNRWLSNETHYIVNLNLTREAPPPIPDDPNAYPYFLYWCGETFGDFAEVPAARRAEFERLLKKYCPAQQWLVVLVNYV